MPPLPKRIGLQFLVIEYNLKMFYKTIFLKEVPCKFFFVLTFVFNKEP